MKVMLVGFSQGVSLEDRNRTVNYLDFRRENGRQFRLPISSEALEELMTEVYREEGVSPALISPPEESVTEPAPEDVEGATEFGGYEPADREEAEPGSDDEEEQVRLPMTEEEVPSL